MRNKSQIYKKKYIYSCRGRDSDVFIVNFEKISHIFVSIVEFEQVNAGRIESLTISLYILKVNVKESKISRDMVFLQLLTFNAFSLLTHLFSTSPGDTEIEY